MASGSSGNDDSIISEHENSWRQKFPIKIVCVLSIIQMLFTLVILILEIASLTSVRNGNSTGVGIWCALPFTIASIFTINLAFRKKGSRIWATRAFIAQIFLTIFTCILVGITGDYISNESNARDQEFYIDLNRKYKIIQSELAFGILLMFSGLFYIGIYFHVTYVALWKPYHTIDTAHLFRK